MPLIECTWDNTGKVLMSDSDIDPDSRLEVRDGAATGIISRVTSTQTTDSNKAFRVRVIIVIPILSL